MQENATTISNGFADATHCNNAGEDVGVVPEPEKYLKKGRDCEEGDEEGIDAEGGIVPIDGVLDWTAGTYIRTVEKDFVCHCERRPDRRYSAWS
jgi:hypothetical protein